MTGLASNTSQGEIRARSLVVVGRVGGGVGPVAVHVRPWKGCTKEVDMLLPHKKLIIHHDGSSHDRQMPVDREAHVPKWERDPLWDMDAWGEGFKVLRLHWRDEKMWKEFIRKSYEQCDKGDLTPLYTPSV